MFIARALCGLPVYGPPALSFPKPNAFREGFVVEFASGEDETWIGNFAKSWEGWPSSIHSDLGPRAVLVVAGGAGYIVDAEQRQLVREIGSDIQHIWFQGELRAFVISNGLWFEAFDAAHTLWRSRRFSWDGIRKVERSGMTASGEAFDPMSDQWVAFRLSLLDGEVEGGSF